MRLRSLRAALTALACITIGCSPGADASLCTGAKSDLRDAGTLTVAADLTYPPFAYDRPGADPAGFDADLIRALGKALKLDVLFVNRGTAALVPGLLAHRHDIAVAGLRDVEPLRSEACLSAPYLDADLGIVVSAPDPHDITGEGDLDGRTVGVLGASRAQRWAAEHLDHSELHTFPADPDLLDALRDRKVEAVVEDLAMARYAVRTTKDVAVAGTITTDEHYVLAAAPDNGALITKLNAALAKLRTSGRLAKIEAKWFGP